MKKITLLSIIALLFLSCYKDDKTNTTNSYRSSENNNNSNGLQTKNNNCDCSENDATRIANSMVREIEKSQFDVSSEDFIDVRIYDLQKNSDCSYSVTFKVQNNGERVAGWNSAETITKTINCR